MKRVYILLVNWNGWYDTIECLESLQRLDLVEYRIIVCDNASSDGSLDKLKAWADGLLSPFPDKFVPKPTHSFCGSRVLPWVEYDRRQAELGGDPDLDPQLILIQTGANLGFAGGNNVGLRYFLARGDGGYVWLLNNDTVVAPDSLARLLERFNENPSIGQCGSTLLHYDRPERIQARGGGWYCKWIGLPWHLGQLQRAGTPTRRVRVERWMNYVVGASLLVSRDFLDRVGLMCEDYFLFFEELDWALRGRNQFFLAYAPGSMVYHKIGRSIGTSSDPRKKSLTCDYYALRNRLLFTKRHFPYALPSIYLSVALAGLCRLLLGRWQHARIALLLLFGRDPGPPMREDSM